MKFTEGAFRDWNYSLAAREFRNDVAMAELHLNTVIPAARAARARNR
jgi:isocitrate dehydrogenase